MISEISIRGIEPIVDEIIGMIGPNITKIFFRFIRITFLIGVLEEIIIQDIIINFISHFFADMMHDNCGCNRTVIINHIRLLISVFVEVIVIHQHHAFAY